MGAIMKDRILYFGYGSNLNKSDLDAWCKKKGYTPIWILSGRLAILKDYKIDFNYYSFERQGGTANIMEAKGEQVEGVVYELLQEDLDKIAEKEGAPKYYNEIRITVGLIDESQLGNVITFKVVKERETTEFQQPTRKYLQIIIDGARKNGLSQGWIDKLRRIPTRD